ncbi:hypothetical protein [Collimonas pratensis]|uniref:hypothetical protein n=1 Tax=Collimonas pratensis TaxID=279113 RepID=UPI000783A48C|nr:hypothetical protein [Collimonas pratensis]
MERRLEELGEVIMSHAKIGFLTMLLLAPITYYLRSDPLLATTASIGILSSLCSLAFLVVSIFSAIPFFLKIRKAPYSFFLGAVESSMRFDFEYVDRLAQCNAKAIKYVLTHYKNERTGLEKRGAVLSGSIDKIGLFPALGAIAILSAGLANIQFANGWVQMLVPLILAFHFLNLIAFGMLQKIDRVVALLEYSVSSRS